uniref:UDP-glucuronosyltransferase n=1 Tax=Heliothis virescens TaxID=7102 RepID=A0A2A4J3R4_HELVI
MPYVKQRGRQAPSFYDVRYNVSLILGNSHVSMGQALALPQNYKPVGGYHIDEDVKPLPQDLEKIMMSAKNGVIYFSMGSNLKSKDWPEKVKRDLLDMFGQLKQTVLWKFEEDLPNVPKNVHILKWAPQPSILSHPKCVLFITHGGLLSTTETTHYGVPIIGIPVFGDQFINVKRAIKKGFALEVNLSYNVSTDLKAAIEEILHNPKYRQKVKELSFIYHDRIAKPGAELLHWVQHVINTKGALHLQSPALHVPLYQRLFLDLLGLLSALLLVLFILLRFLCNLVCSKKQKETKVKVVGKKKKN